MNDDQISLLLISALEYNASIVSLASIYYGNCRNNPKLAKKASKEFQQIMDHYGDKVKAILEDETLGGVE